MKTLAAWLLGWAAWAFAPHAAGAPFATPGGPEPANVAEAAALLKQDRYDLELLISFGTSKGGSAGHLALAIRDAAPNGDDLVYSANFYADRAPAHEKNHYIDELVVAIPKMEYLYGTSSTLDPKAAFGLDFGEVYKRSVVGVRVYGVPAREKEGLAAFFQRMNADFRRKARDAEYHDREVKYDYLRLNCAKAIASGFKYGAGYKELKIKHPKLLPGFTSLVSAFNANIPTEMAMQLVKAWNRRGYRMDTVLYRKYEASPFVDPLDEVKVAFKDLPNRFPSVMSLDFRNDQGGYEDYDNLHAMYLFYNLGRYSLKVNAQTQRIEVGMANTPMDYPVAEKLAKQSAEEDSKGFLRRLPYTPKGKAVGSEEKTAPPSQ
jgi:hypothetical protein